MPMLPDSVFILHGGRFWSSKFPSGRLILSSFNNKKPPFSERVNAARTALDTARTNLAVSKSLLQKSEQAESPDITTVSDEEEESKESKEAANSSAQKITDSLQHLGESQNFERQCGRVNVGRTASQQAATHRAARTHAWKQYVRKWGLVFSLGRICVTPEYAVQWPQDVGILPPTVDHHLKWTHSIVHEPDYCSEWVAAHRATELALQCGKSTFQLPSVSVNDRRKAVGCLSVRFHPLVDVFLGNDEVISMHSITVPAEVLPHVAKPWSCYHQSQSVNRTLPML